jgi:CBS domain-containing protein
MTTAREIMHDGARCIPAHETLDRAAQMMSELNVGALPICGPDDRLIGMLTDRDIVVKCIGQGKDPARVTASELAEGAPRWVEADTDVDEALKIMQTHRIRRLPVIENKRLVGMISECDIVRHLSEAQVYGFAERIYAQT